jgi:hypothetical protein
MHPSMNSAIALPPRIPGLKAWMMARAEFRGGKRRGIALDQDDDEGPVGRFWRAPRSAI